MFLGGLSVIAHVRPPVRLFVWAYVLLARHLASQWTEFHQILFDDVVRVTDHLVKV